jgi:hypothetical protein
LHFSYCSWDDCKRVLLDGSTVEHTGKLMDLLIAFRNYEWRRIWYGDVLPALKEKYRDDPSFGDGPVFEEPSGSTVRTSDVDVPVWNGPGAGEAVVLFNKEFRKRWYARTLNTDSFPGLCLLPRLFWV